MSTSFLLLLIPSVIAGIIVLALLTPERQTIVIYPAPRQSDAGFGMFLLFILILAVLTLILFAG